LWGADQVRGAAAGGAFLASIAALFGAMAAARSSKKGVD